MDFGARIHSVSPVSALPLAAFDHGVCGTAVVCAADTGCTSILPNAPLAAACRRISGAGKVPAARSLQVVRGQMRSGASLAYKYLVPIANLVHLLTRSFRLLGTSLRSVTLSSMGCDSDELSRLWCGGD